MLAMSHNMLRASSRKLEAHQTMFDVSKVLNVPLHQQQHIPTLAENILLLQNNNASDGKPALRPRLSNEQILLFDKSNLLQEKFFEEYER